MPDLSKAELRARMLAARKSLDDDARAIKSSAIVHRIRCMPQWKAARTVLLYMPTGAEVDVRPLLREALEEEKRCLLPRCVGDILELYAVRDMERDLRPGVFGLLEPVDCGPCCNGESIDIMLVPGVAFDPRGYRIGYGKGYFDRLLPAYPCAALVAPAYALQIVPRVPDAPHDIPVRWIATEDELLDCTDNGGTLWPNES